MPTARQIITSALTFHLNRLSPGEVLDADLSALCLSALNDIADEWSGSGTFLFRDILDSATLTGITGTLGTDFLQIDPGQEILGATYNNGAGDFPIDELTMQQYHEQVRIKTLSGGLPRYYACDGLATLYFYPALTGQTIKLHAHQAIADFADLDTVYSMPQGYRSGLAAVLAELVAPGVVGGVPANVAKAANDARSRIAAQSAAPGIIGGGGPSGNVLTGWR